ncbi:HDR012Wp [Eremothecium sinecaudum]|uniref:Altered inheritance of mitochondria protein 21 n=1 Tax=Eremothecium sinecaudum TaxID=45286 RepID=A0A0X8HSP4_9SACH|nr:HDR012Wp [Eremothecium sinecaudum]AMD20755.1 HDR012Wp [Eremothecium sinecaudum]
MSEIPPIPERPKIPTRPKGRTTREDGMSPERTASPYFGISDDMIQCDSKAGDDQFNVEIESESNNISDSTVLHFEAGFKQTDSFVNDYLSSSSYYEPFNNYADSPTKPQLGDLLTREYKKVEKATRASSIGFENPMVDKSRSAGTPQFIPPIPERPARLSRKPTDTISKVISSEQSEGYPPNMNEDGMQPSSLDPREIASTFSERSSMAVEGSVADVPSEGSLFLSNEKKQGSPSVFHPLSTGRIEFELGTIVNSPTEEINQLLNQALRKKMAEQKSARASSMDSNVEQRSATPVTPTMGPPGGAEDKNAVDDSRSQTGDEGMQAGIHLEIDTEMNPIANSLTLPPVPRENSLESSVWSPKSKQIPENETKTKTGRVDDNKKELSSDSVDSLSKAISQSSLSKKSSEDQNIVETVPDLSPSVDLGSPSKTEILTFKDTNDDLNPETNQGFLNEPSSMLLTGDRTGDASKCSSKLRDELGSSVNSDISSSLKNVSSTPRSTNASSTSPQKPKNRPLVPKKPSSKIAAFQEMLQRQQAEHLGSKHFEEHNHSSVNKVGTSRANFAQNLNGLFSLSGKPPLQLSPSVVKKQSSHSPDSTNEYKSKSPSDSSDSRETMSADVRQSRARGPAGRKLPRGLANLEKVNPEQSTNQIETFHTWRVVFKPFLKVNDPATVDR